MKHDVRQATIGYAPAPSPFFAKVDGKKQPPSYDRLGRVAGSDGWVGWLVAGLAGWLAGWSVGLRLVIGFELYILVTLHLVSNCHPMEVPWWSQGLSPEPSRAPARSLIRVSCGTLGTYSCTNPHW